MTRRRRTSNRTQRYRKKVSKRPRTKKYQRVQKKSKTSRKTRRRGGGRLADMKKSAGQSLRRIKDRVRETYSSLRNRLRRRPANSSPVASAPVASAPTPEQFMRTELTSSPTTRNLVQQAVDNNRKKSSDPEIPRFRDTWLWRGEEEP